MKRIGVRELRQNASEYIRLARAGESVEICERSTPVAILSALPVRGAIERLERLGRLSPAEGDLLDLGAPLEPGDGEPLPSQVLARQRDTER
jgi:prevent-host-death family protein